MSAVCSAPCSSQVLWESSTVGRTNPLPGAYTAPYCHVCTAIYRTMFLHWLALRVSGQWTRITYSQNEVQQLAMKACGCILGQRGVGWVVRRGYLRGMWRVALLCAWWCLRPGSACLHVFCRTPFRVRCPLSSTPIVCQDTERCSAAPCCAGVVGCGDGGSR